MAWTPTAWTPMAGTRMVWNPDQHGTEHLRRTALTRRPWTLDPWPPTRRPWTPTRPACSTKPYASTTSAGLRPSSLALDWSLLASSLPQQRLCLGILRGHIQRCLLFEICPLAPLAPYPRAPLAPRRAPRTQPNAVSQVPTLWTQPHLLYLDAACVAGLAASWRVHGGVCVQRH